MLLKRIEILGFKSFGQKTVLDINPGTTAIVGPNGCGKSNVVDAIRWVLGEQSSKELRGSNMQDIIFNGTNNIKPLGMAEVSMVIEDTENKLPIDFTEVRVTRRLFRTGESQYFINKKICRLKDIQELFMDTGVGNDSYAIMVQGKMDQMLTSKPEDRRTFFEEAAGITKYKTKRNEALRKLTRTEENLSRVGDILRELEKNISSLKIKAGKARKYKECFDRLKELETLYTVIQTQSILKEVHDLAIKKNDKDEILKCIREAIALQEKQLQEIRLTLESSDETYRHGFEELNTLRMQTEQKAQEKILDEKRIEDALSQKEALSLEVGRLKEKVQETRGLLDELCSSEKEFRQTLEEKEQILEEKEQSISNMKEEISSTQTMLQEKTDESLRKAQEESHIRNKLIELSATKKNFSGQKERIHSESAMLTRYLSEIDHTIEGKLQDILSFKNSIEEEKFQKDFVQKALNEAKSEVDSEEKKLLDVKASLSEKTSRMKALDTLEKNYEGFFSGIKKIMEKRNQGKTPLQSIIGTVSDIISADKDYADAVEIALGNRIQNIVVETPENASSSIRYLKENKLGRASFLPLETFEGHKRASWEPEDGIIGHILDFIKFDKKYESVLNFLLGKTLVVSTLDAAVTISKRNERRFHFITVDGDHITPNGVITGGYSKGSIKGIISRKSEISELEGEIQKDTEERDLLQTEATKKKEQLEALSQNLLDINKVLTEKQIEFHEKESALREEKTKLETTQKNIETMASELNIIETQLQEMQTSEQNCSSELDALHIQTSSLEDELRTMKGSIEHKIKDIEIVRDAISEIRIQKASVTERLDAINRRKTDYSNTIEDVNRDATRKENEITRLEETRKHLEEHIAEITSVIETLHHKEHELKENISRIEEERNRLRKDEGLMSESIHNNNIKLQVEQEELSAVSVQITEMEGKMAHYIENYQTRYDEEISKETISETQIGETNLEEMETEIETLRRRMKYLGPVSLDAIKEFEELQERYTFLQKQQNDLHNAKVDLLKIINKLNKQAKDQFAENFEKIRVLFKEMFSTLFGGGKADIYLTDENDVLESGIEIMAKPPGKPNQSISLLSGGEKALASIALLFAIFKLKPSFFCVLDELDAPLDESNIIRFLEMLKSLEDKTQFLIITHNKTTINIADFIYGVTMPTPGLSTTVSVNVQSRNKPKAQPKKVINKTEESLWEQREMDVPSQPVFEESSRISNPEPLEDRLSDTPEVISEASSDNSLKQD